MTEHELGKSLICQNEKGNTKIDVYFEDRKLPLEATIRKFRIVKIEGSRNINCEVGYEI